MFTQPVRKLSLSTHITFSVGWLGAVASFLILSLVGYFSSESQVVRSCYICMGILGWFIIVPASLGSFFTGIIQAQGTKWGLFKHYWIVAKLVLTLVCTLLLLVHVQPIDYMAELAGQGSISDPGLNAMRIRLIADAAAAFFVLLVITTISVYKPWETISWNPELRNFRILSVRATRGQSLKFYILFSLVILFVLLILWHLKSGGMGNH